MEKYKLECNDSIYSKEREFVWRLNEVEIQRDKMKKDYDELLLKYKGIHHDNEKLKKDIENMKSKLAATKKNKKELEEIVNREGRSNTYINKSSNQNPNEDIIFSKYEILRNENSNLNSQVNLKNKENSKLSKEKESLLKELTFLRESLAERDKFRNSFIDLDDKLNENDGLGLDNYLSESNDSNKSKQEIKNNNEIVTTSIKVKSSNNKLQSITNLKNSIKKKIKDSKLIITDEKDVLKLSSKKALSHLYVIDTKADVNTPERRIKSFVESAISNFSVKTNIEEYEIDKSEIKNNYEQEFKSMKLTINSKRSSNSENNSKRGSAIGKKDEILQKSIFGANASKYMKEARVKNLNSSSKYSIVSRILDETSVAGIIPEIEFTKGSNHNDQKNENSFESEDLNYSLSEKDYESSKIPLKIKYISKFEQNHNFLSEEFKSDINPSDNYCSKSINDELYDMNINRKLIFASKYDDVEDDENYYNAK